jgi:Flp pilus assembly protein TadB
MAIAVLAGVLIALVAAPAASTLQPVRGQSRPDVNGVRRRRSQALDSAALLDSIARQVRSGSSLATAIVAEADTSAPLHEVADRLAAGSSLTEALAAFSQPHDPDWALTIQALAATARLGGPIAATLDEAAAVLRERSAARAERVAHGAQARLSARVLTIVPIGFAGWSVVASRRTGNVYTSSVAGGMCALFGLTLNFVGWRWMKKIIGRP